MKTKLLTLTAMTLIAASIAKADDLALATSEDAQNFDQQIAASLKNSKGSDKQKKENFGAQVSAEAKRFNDDGIDKKKEFGKWVSGERKKSDQARPDASAAERSGGSKEKSDKGSKSRKN